MFLSPIPPLLWRRLKYAEKRGIEALKEERRAAAPKWGEERGPRNSFAPTEREKRERNFENPFPKLSGSFFRREAPSAFLKGPFRSYVGFF